MRRIFDAALALPEEERDEFLTAACDGDGQLVHELRGLLDSVDEADDFLESPIFGGAEPSTVEDEHWMGDRLGPYRIDGLLGEGGMGVVLAAHRDDADFEQLVAIKVLRAGAGPKLGRRLESERRILAQLEHPNIARLLDGGTTPEGGPYLVMERVLGIPINASCDAQRLTINDRIRVFRRVCDAVHFAHQHLIVHRDLKPSNILVEEHAGPKLVDFGIAKILAEIDDGTSGLTTRILTPQYASPEQLRGGMITTASDIFSLGVVLFELLTGRLPYDRDLDSGSTPGSTPDGVLTPPSRILSQQLPATDKELFIQSHDTPIEGVQRQLRGDLDTIVAKALHTDSKQRYSSADELSRDLERFLAGLPVAARPPSVRYRAAKLFQRHRIAAIFGGVALATLIVFATMTKIQSVRLADANDQTTAVLDFLVQSFEDAGPIAGQRTTMTTEELLDRARAGLDTSPPKRPAVAATLQQTLGKLYVDLGLSEKALPLLESALETRRQLYGHEHELVAESLQQLAAAQRLAGAYPEASATAESALAIRRAIHGNSDSRIGDSLQLLASLANDQAQFDAGVRLAKEAAAIHRRARGPGDPSVATDLDTLAFAFWELGEWQEAREALSEALDIRRQHFGPKHTLVAESVNALGVINWSYGQMDEAERLFRQAFELQRELLGEHPVVAEAAGNLANALMELGRLDEAVSLFHTALDMDIAIFGEEHPNVSRSLGRVGMLEMQRHRYSESTSSYRRAVVIERAVRSGPHPDFEYSVRQLGFALLFEGRYPEALPLLSESNDMAEELFSDEHPDRAFSWQGLGTWYHDTGQLDQALDFFQQSLELKQNLLGDHKNTAAAMRSIARVRQHQGDLDSALELRRESLTMLRSVRPPEDPLLAIQTIEYAALLARQGQLAAAHESMAPAMELLSNPGDSLEFARAQCFWSELRLAEGAATAALDAANDCYRLHQQRLTPEHWKTAVAATFVAAALTAQGRHKEADELARTSLGSMTSVLGPKSPYLAEARRRIDAATRTPG